MNHTFFELMKPRLQSSRTVDRAWEDLFGLSAPRWSRAPASDGVAFLPPLDVEENAQNWLLLLDVPGVKKEDLKLDVEGRRLTISGERHLVRQEQRDDGESTTKRAHGERRFGMFSRSFTLPDGADIEGIMADQREGVLTVTIPKKPQSARKSITINPG